MLMVVEHYRSDVGLVMSSKCSAECSSSELTAVSQSCPHVRRLITRRRGLGGVRSKCGRQYCRLVSLTGSVSATDCRICKPRCSTGEAAPSVYRAAVWEVFGCDLALWEASTRQGLRR